MGVSSRSKNTILAVIIVALIITAAVALVFVIYRPDNNKKGPSAVEDCPGVRGPSQGPPLMTTIEPKIEHQRAPSRDGMYRHAATASDNHICSKIGIDILSRLQGSVTDAAVATLFCLGAVDMQDTGLGGGHFMTIYDTPRGGSSKEVTTIFAREVAPLAATRDMYVNKSGASKFGGLAVGVPGQLAGLHSAWQRFGKLEWKELVMPSIRLCHEGFQVGPWLSFAIKYREDMIRADPNMALIFVKSDGSLVTEGDVMTLPKLGDTLQQVAEDPMSFYSGSLADDIVQDLADYGSIITAEDLAKYKTREKPPLSVTLQNGNFTMYSPRPPSSGAILQYILNILDEFKLTPSNDNSDQRALTYHHTVEAFKFAFGQRSALGDEDFVNVTELLNNLKLESFAEETMLKINGTHTQDLLFYGPKFEIVEDHGTAHASILAPDGSAVSITGTINLPLGAVIRGKRTGIIFNNEMDDFSTPGTVNFFGVPASPSNYIEPGKMPMSSMSPSLVFNQDGNVVLVIGASGGTKIITSLALIVAENLWLGQNLKEAVDRARIHHQLLPNTILVEDGFNLDIQSALEAYGHETVKNGLAVSQVHAIHSTCGECRNITCIYEPCIHAVSDTMKGGYPNGF